MPSLRISEIKEQKSRRCLVAGGAGFLGFHLSKRLLDEGCEVIAIDNLSTGQIKNVQKLALNPAFSFVQHDIIDPIDMVVDEIYNLACPASPVHYQADPIQTLKTNVHGSLNLLELAVKNKARIFQASTSEVYGDPDIHPQPESYRGSVNSFGPRACYDEGKRCAETLFYDFNRRYGVDIRIARIFNTYGPHMHAQDGRVVSNFIVQALNNENITIYGSGNQTRSFCYVDDLIEGFIRLMRMAEPIHEPVNIGNPDEFTVGQLARKVIRLTGSSSRLINLPLPTDDPRQRKPDIRRAQELLGWEPKVPLDLGLAKTIEYFSGLVPQKQPGFKAA